MFNVNEVLYKRPQAVAMLIGSEKYPKVRGEVRFFQTGQGVLVSTEMTGLPYTKNRCDGTFFGWGNSGTDSYCSFQS